MSKSLEYAKNKIKAIDPHIIVSRNIYKPYYSIRYYDLSDNIWHIGFSSYELKFVTEWLKTEFEIVESDIEPVRHGKWIGKNGNRVYDYWKCSVCGKYADTANHHRLDNYCGFCGAKMDLGDDEE